MSRTRRDRSRRAARRPGEEPGLPDEKAIPETSTGFTPTRHELGRDARPDDVGRSSDEQVGDAGLPSAGHQHLLHVEHQHQEHGEHHRAHDRSGHVAPRSVLVRSSPTRMSGSGTELPADEAGEDKDTTAKPIVLPARPPSCPACVIASTREERPAVTSACAGRSKLLTGWIAGSRRAGRRDDRALQRDVDEEDPPGWSIVGPSHERSRSSTQAADCAPDAERDVPLAALMNIIKRSRRCRSDDRHTGPWKST